MRFFKFCSYIFIFLILILLAHPLYLHQSIYEWIQNSTSKNDKVMIDICAHTRAELSQETKKIHYMYYSYPDEINEDGLRCTNIHFQITKEWKKYDVTFTTDSAEAKISLTSPSNWKNEVWQPILVDYKDLYVNGKLAGMPEITVWDKNPYNFIINNTGNKINTFSISARKHHLKISDIKLIHNTYSDWKLSSVWALAGIFAVIIFSLFLIHRKQYKHLFCFIVFLSLILPVVFISTKENVSKQENRGFNKFPSLLINGNINEKFGIDFDNWLSDRFGGRRFLIDARFFLLYKINNKIENEKAFVGDSNWKFPTKGTKNVDSPDVQHDRNKKIIESLKKIGDANKGKNIQLYLVIEPSRSVLYKKYWDKYYPYIPYYDYIGEMKEQLKGYPEIHFIDLTDTFEANKDKIQLYDKNDPHMTLSAVNLMTEQIVNSLGINIEKKYKESVSYRDKDCKLYNYLNYYDSILKIETTEKKENCKEIIIPDSHIKTVKLEGGINKLTSSKPVVNNDLFILFPCYEEFLAPVLGEFYPHTISVNYNTFDEHDAEILKRNAIAKMKEIKPNTTVLIFLSHPTEYTISKSNDYLEEY